MSIVKADVNHFIVLTHGDLHFLSPLSLSLPNMHATKHKFIATEYLGASVPPYVGGHYQLAWLQTSCTWANTIYFWRCLGSLLVISPQWDPTCVLKRPYYSELDVDSEFSHQCRHYRIYPVTFQ